MDKVAFTGSTEVGKLIIHAAAGNLKKVSLELGGKSPNIVLDDADLDSTIPGASSAIFFNHGQCCCAGSRLYVDKKIFDKVVDGVAASAEKIRVRPGFDPDCDTGPYWFPKNSSIASLAIWIPARKKARRLLRAAPARAEGLLREAHSAR